MATTSDYRDPSLSIDERVADLLSRLTLEEKAAQITQYFYFGSFGGDAPDDVEMEGVPTDDEGLSQPEVVEKALGSGGAGSLLFVSDAASANRLQKLAIDGNPHDIPVIFGFDVIHGFRTIFPVPIAGAASWDPESVRKGQEVAAREARAAGIHWAFAPMVDIARDPRWGRIIEGAGEDPCLGSAMAAAQVRGFQGETIGAPEHIIAGPKHMAGYGAALGGRDYDESDISDAELWNVYLPPFKAAVDAGAGNIMSAYMELNGVPASGNTWLLTDVLRGTFGFDGWVVSDANAVRSLMTQHFAKDLTDAGARAVNAGMDMEMCMLDPAYAHLPEAVAQGLVSEDVIDEAVRRVLRAKFAMGVFENPYVDEAAAETTLTDPAHREAARLAAERTAVLLKNDNATLPLKAESKIAVIGYLADSARDTVGPWVFVQDDSETVTLLDGIRARVGDRGDVTYAAGLQPDLRVFPSMFDQMDGVVRESVADFDDTAEMGRAVEAAAAADVAVVVIGQPQHMIGEFASSSTLALPGRQEELVKAVIETGTPVVVLVMSGRPLDLRWVSDNVPAILQIWYPGTQGGAAVANVLFGDVSPGGKLPFTWPRTVGQVPMPYSHYRTFQPENQGRRYWDEESTPLYPFGHGLSYGAFTYDNLRLDRDSVRIGETVSVSVDVTNTSDREADEVVQLYIHQAYGTSARPLRELKGFSRVTIAAGATQTVTLPLGPDQLRYWSAVPRDWVQDGTTIEVYVGGSSTAELTTTFEVTA